MARKTQSIDGFTLKRRDDISPDTTDERVFLDSMQSQPATQKLSEHGLGLQKAEIDSAKDIISADIEESLQGLESEPDQLPKPGKKPGHAKKLKKSRSRKEKRIERRRRHPIRRIVKWIFIIIFSLLFALIGWLTFKALITGSKIFQGNIFDAFTTKARLAEDKSGRTNILIFGTEGEGIDTSTAAGALLTDSIMVLSVDQNAKNAYMISLPRDLWVQRDCPALRAAAGKLNEIYACNYLVDKNEEKAAKYFMKTAGEIVGLEMQYYVHLDYKALRETVDAVGGVDVMIESNDPRGIYDVGTGIKYPNGEVHLNGEKALALARARGAWGGYGLPGSNFAREKYQQKILAALQKKALSTGTLANPIAVSSLLDVLGDNLRTSFKTSEVQTLTDLAKNIKSEDIISLPLVSRDDKGPDLVMTGMVGSSSIVRPVRGLYDYSDIIGYVAQNLSANPVTREAAKIDVLNGSGQAGLAQKKADELEKTGYFIGKVVNAPANISEKVKIYQSNASKTATAAALEKYFNVKIISGKLDGYKTESDFTIVFGAAAID
ncbi:MAG: LCP family protein [Candidatus Nomurabacteria bacterium]|jgi:LCP family protein required for cell wall assembly|nr:LCP family protein [Candidatus Nomurabacteria bacterium]